MTLEIELTQTWQREILAFEPNNRQIELYYNPRDTASKTDLCVWLIQNKDVSYFTSAGEALSALTAVYKRHKSHNKLKCVVFDLPRTHTVETDYAVIDAVKNGIWHSGTDQVIINNPRVIIFDNVLPRWKALSADRWVVREILEDQTLGPTIKP